MLIKIIIYIIDIIIIIIIKILEMKYKPLFNVKHKQPNDLPNS